ncbi:MAG TPA: hypothetical protein VK464_28590 [Symbiobacteriaceae bacterium]|jgi:hypothetical protein|nr:hypothetical protein [Symbiobacteriaceae bacterium]
MLWLRALVVFPLTILLRPRRARWAANVRSVSVSSGSGGSCAGTGNPRRPSQAAALRRRSASLAASIYRSPATSRSGTRLKASA